MTRTIPAQIQAKLDEIFAANRSRFGHDAFRMEFVHRMPSDDELNAVRNGQGLNGLGVADSAKALREDVWGVMQAITTAANADGDRPLRASEARAYDAAQGVFNELTDIIAENTVDRRGVVAPTNVHEGYRLGEPLAKDQSYVGALRALGAISAEQDQAPLSLGKYLKGIATGDWKGAQDELNVRNVLSGADSAAGGILIPEILSGSIVDAARAKTRVIEAGAQIVPMPNRKVTVPKWVSDPVPQWRDENTAFAEDDAAMTSLELSAKGLGVVTKVSLELLEDTDIQTELEAAFARSFSQVLDLAALYSTGEDDPDGNPTPTGVKSWPGVHVEAAATNGATPTWATLVNAVGRLRDVNEEPTAQIMADRTLRTLSMLAGTDGQYIAAPSYLDGVPRLTTGQVPTNLDQGTSLDNTSDLFTGDWSKLLIGVRSELRIFVLRERYLADAGQIGFVCHWRGDFAVTRPAAFDVVTGIKA